MLCIWVIIAFVILAAVVIYWVKTTPAVPDDGQMSRSARNSIALYLIVLAVILAYIIVRLFSVHFDDNQAPTKPHTVACATTPLAATAAPDIQELFPPFIKTATTLPSIRVLGCNFTAQSKVRFNKTDRVSEFTGEHEILVLLTDADVAATKPIYVDVVNADKVVSAPVVLNVQSPQTVVGDLFICRSVFPITEETRLLLLVILAGALGSYIHALKSLADFIGNRTLTASWAWFYVSRPFLGMALAVIFYAALRGGFLAGSPADVKAVNPFGAFTVAALVGMFTDSATQKLAEIFDTLFKTSDQRKDKLQKLDITTKVLSKPVVGTPYSQRVEATGGDPPYRWSATALPPGLQIDAATGIIAGNPTKVDQATVTVHVVDTEHQEVAKELPFQA